MNRNLINEIKKICVDGVSENVSLKSISRWKVGGIADCIIEPKNKGELKKLLVLFKRKKVTYVSFGATSNLLFSDKGLRAVAIKIGPRMSGYKKVDNVFDVLSGMWVPAFALSVAKAGFVGVEHICGIPATMGGLTYMNGGSQRKSISSNIISVVSIDLCGNEIIRKKNECNFSYRHSIFHENNEIIISTKIIFKYRDRPSEIKRRMLSILRERREKFTSKIPNCGSVFISNPELYKKFGPPGKILEDIGFKNYRIGGAQVSNKHANFVNNINNATADDIREIIYQMQRAVKSHTGYVLKPEARFVNEDGQISSII